MAALHAEAVPSEVVVAAGRTNEPPRRIRLQPPLVLAPVPDPVLWAERPPPAFVVEHGEVSDRDPEGPRLQAPGAPLLDQGLVAALGFREGIHSHAGEYCADRCRDSADLRRPLRPNAVVSSWAPRSRTASGLAPVLVASRASAAWAPQLSPLRAAVCSTLAC